VGQKINKTKHKERERERERGDRNSSEKGQRRENIKTNINKRQL
jgi:hypothetical protein